MATIETATVNTNNNNDSGRDRDNWSRLAKRMRVMLILCVKDHLISTVLMEEIFQIFLDHEVCVFNFLSDSILFHFISFSLIFNMN